jgi:hypothetical protein
VLGAISAASIISLAKISSPWIEQQENMLDKVSERVTASLGNSGKRDV